MRPTLRNACIQGVVAAWLAVLPSSLVYAVLDPLVSSTPLTVSNVLAVATVSTIAAAVSALVLVPLYAGRVPACGLKRP